MMNTQPIVDACAGLGECPIWCERFGTLYWTDIEGTSLHSWRKLDGWRRRWLLPEAIGSFALTEDDHRLLLGMASGIAMFDTSTESLSFIALVEEDEPTTRINDGRCDRQGRFVFGMFNPAEKPIGHFYRVHHDLSVEKLSLPPAGVGNSIAFSPDGSTMYFTDSPTRVIQCVEYAANGRLGVPRVFSRLAECDGFPDGSTVDADGGLWNAQWQGSCVVRYDTGGSETCRFDLPASQITCPTLGGTQFDELYLTSARQGLNAKALEIEPAAGGVFMLQVPWQGLPETRFLSVV